MTLWIYFFINENHRLQVESAGSYNVPEGTRKKNRMQTSAKTT
jgi:hypothetical protein